MSEDLFITVPYGSYKNPCIVNETTLRAASRALRSAVLLCGDYLDVLQEHARAGDFVFLDPPYVPVSLTANFSGYTKERFREPDHLKLGAEVRRLRELGCEVVLTNSNTPFTRALYAGLDLRVVQTRRNVSSNSAKCTGEDLTSFAPHP